MHANLSTTTPGMQFKCTWWFGFGYREGVPLSDSKNAVVQSSHSQKRSWQRRTPSFYVSGFYSVIQYALFTMIPILIHESIGEHQCSTSTVHLKWTSLSS
ncbi:hypothetical protein BD410DRAFT_792012 [Rickenella mellea]|uniref:Uncharacterized protein n=1 Tax=Rickenella mellea TaxID=50990 RepID=A0A4Y7PX87_9AGAM|nr:hypothetical protein BD410DRAFT_792012 [Rickenella mellea]